MPQAFDEISRRALGFLALLFLAVPTVSGDAAPASASGRFETEKTSLDIRGAYAFWWKSASPVSSDEPVIRVAVANGVLTPDDFDKFYDRPHAINARFANDEHKVVFYEFTASGKYHGLSYYFGSGDGCGYCFDSEVRSTVRLAAGRLKGHVGFKEKNRVFDIDLDVQVPEKEWGKPLAEDGGEIGKVYLAYEAALEARDTKAVRALLDARMKEHWQKMEKEGKLDRYVEYTWKEKHLEMKSPRVTGGFVHSDRAVLLVEGQSGPYGSVHGEALMRQEEGSWRFSEELLGVE